MSASTRSTGPFFFRTKFLICFRKRNEKRVSPEGKESEAHQQGEGECARELQSAGTEIRWGPQNTEERGREKEEDEKKKEKEKKKILSPAAASAARARRHRSPFGISKTPGARTRGPGPRSPCRRPPGATSSSSRRGRGGRRPRGRMRGSWESRGRRARRARRRGRGRQRATATSAAGSARSSAEGWPSGELLS